MPKKNKNLLSFFFGSLSLIILAYAAILVLAPNLVQADLVPACGESGACGFCDIVNVFVTLGTWLIEGGAGLGLLLIIWAGITMVTSAGNSERVGAAKKQIIGVIIGLGIVLAAFQFVTILIAMVVTPSHLATAPEGINPSQETKDISSLSDFLGVPWWTICSLQDMQAKGGKDTANGSTAHCRYWGDNTPCDREGKGSSVCCNGECKSAPCVSQATNAVKAVRPGTQTQTGQLAQESEEAVRRHLKAGGVEFWREDSCPIGDTTGTGCTNVAGLPVTTQDALIEAAQSCGDCIMITGGTEAGHNTHCPGRNVVDVDVSLSNFSVVTRALQNAGVPYNGNFGVGYTCEAGGGRVDCPTDGWLHIEIGQNYPPNCN